MTMKPGGSWAFPVRTDATGRIVLVRGVREAVEAVEVVLSTRPGERRMRPDFGTTLPFLVAGEVLDSQTSRELMREVQSAVSRFVADADVVDVSVTNVEGDPGAIDITVQVRSRQTGELRTITYRPLAPEASESTASHDTSDDRIS